ncbi:MAG: MFS transporter [Anaerolineae bacterium]
MKSLVARWWRNPFLALAGPLPPEVRFNFNVDLLGAICFGIFFAAAVSFVPVVLRRLGATENMLAFYTTSTYFGSFLSLFSLMFLRRFPTLPFALTTWTIGRGFFFATVFATGPIGMLILTSCFWVAEGLPGPAYTQLMQRVYPANYRGRAMSAVRWGMAMSLVITTPLAGWALEIVGYQVVFPIAACLALASLVLFSRMRLAPGVSQSQPTLSMRRMFDILHQDRRFSIYLLALTVFGLGGLAALPLYPIVQVSRLNLSYAFIGYLGLAQSVTWMLGLTMWGRWLDRLGPMWLLRVCLLINAVVPFTYAVAWSGWLLLPAFIAQGLVSGAFDLAILNASIQMAPSGRVIEYNALQTTIIGLRGMIGPWLGVLILAFGAPFAVVFVLAGVMMLASWVIVRRINVPRHQADEAAPVQEEPQPVLAVETLD